jgi:hypothetical protein
VFTILKKPPSRTAPSESERHSFSVPHTVTKSDRNYKKMQQTEPFYTPRAVLSVQWESLLSWLHQVFYNIVTILFSTSKSLGFWTLPSVRNSQQLEVTTFRKLDLLPSSGERSETFTPLGPVIEVSSF